MRPSYHTKVKDPCVHVYWLHKASLSCSHPSRDHPGSGGFRGVNPHRDLTPGHYNFTFGYFWPSQNPGIKPINPIHSKGEGGLSGNENWTALSHPSAYRMLVAASHILEIVHLPCSTQRRWRCCNCTTVSRGGASTPHLQQAHASPSLPCSSPSLNFWDYFFLEGISEIIGMCFLHGV
jgi:hypothetical protein